MQFQQAPPQMRAMNRSSPETTMPVNTEPNVKEIPYDYVAKFALQGKPANRVQDVINISVEGAFVAVAIGYSFIPAASQSLPEIPPRPPGGGDDPPPTPNTTLVRLIAGRVVTALSIGDTDREKTVSQLATVIQPFVEPRELMQLID